MPLEIAQLGQPALRVQAEPVPVEIIKTPEFQNFLDEMHATLKEARGVGLAAPQVFSNRRVFLAAVLPAEQPDDDPVVEFLINPRIVEPSASTATGGTNGVASNIDSPAGSSAGSTGACGLASNAATLVATWRFTNADVLLHALPIFHVHGLFVAINTVLAAGASMLFTARFEADQVIELGDELAPARGWR